MPYLLDSNVFIQAKNFHYGFDFCPAFWIWIDVNNESDTVFSIERVKTELVGYGDELSNWATVRSDRFFLPPDGQIVPSLAQVSTWARDGGFDAGAVNQFLQDADYYLVAHAHAHGYTVVTHEIPSNSMRRIKIPNACIGNGVPCMSPYEMLRTERARFVLGP
jgi:hypothetical protein